MIRIKGKELKWYTLLWDVNSNKVVKYNIFHSDFNNRISKKLKKGELTSLSDLKEEIRRYCLTYWSRVEYEILVSGLFNREKEAEKIDVFYQVEMNLDRIAEYVNKEFNLMLK